MKGTHASGFVVKVSSSSGLVLWASRPPHGFNLIFGPRESAEVFGTPDEAHAAIGRMPATFENAGFVFAIEAADGTDKARTP